MGEVEFTTCLSDSKAHGPYITPHYYSDSCLTWTGAYGAVTSTDQGMLNNGDEPQPKATMS